MEVTLVLCVCWRCFTVFITLVLCVCWRCFTVFIMWFILSLILCPDEERFYGGNFGFVCVLKMFYSFYNVVYIVINLVSR